MCVLLQCFPGLESACTAKPDLQSSFLRQVAVACVPASAAACGLVSIESL
jgi:hypothetical protein